MYIYDTDIYNGPEFLRRAAAVARARPPAACAVTSRTKASAAVATTSSVARLLAPFIMAPPASRRLPATVAWGAWLRDATGPHIQARARGGGDTPVAGQARLDGSLAQACLPDQVRAQIISDLGSPRAAAACPPGGALLAARVRRGPTWRAGAAARGRRRWRGGRCAACRQGLGPSSPWVVAAAHGAGA